MLKSRYRAKDGGTVSAEPAETAISLRQLGELLGIVCVRPPARGLSAARRADHQLPILVLKVADKAERELVASQIEEWCHQASPCVIPAFRLHPPKEAGQRAAKTGQVPMARAPSPAEDVQRDSALRGMLANIRGGFGEHDFGRLPRFRFSRFELTDTVVDFADRCAGDVRRARLLDHLARLDPLARTMRRAPDVSERLSSDDGPAGTASTGSSKFGAIIAFLTGLISWAARPVLRWRLRTRLAWLGGRYYWFRTNINANKGMLADTSFYNQVIFLSKMARNKPEFFAKYADDQLIGAMLEDFQDSYRRGFSPWRGWARPVYPILIIDDIQPGSARDGLLRQINDNRLAGRWDPLFVIAIVANQRSYAELQRDVRANALGSQADHALRDDADLARLYEEWSSQFPGAMRPVAPEGWFLFMSVDGPVRTEGGRSARHKWSPPTRRRPRWTRISVQVPVVLLCAVVVAAGVAAGEIWRDNTRETRAAAFRQEFCAVQVRHVDGQCVGLAPPGFAFGLHDWTASLDRGIAVGPGRATVSGDVTVTQLERDIAAENRSAERQAAAGRNTLATIVYLGPLTLSAKVSNPQTDGVRELAGVYAAQREWDGVQSDGAQNEPLTRVLVANGGSSMAGQYQIARQIVRLASTGTPIAGVVGVGVNGPSTPETIGVLERAGIPIVGTTNSMDSTYPFYFQLAPDDQREAQVGEDYLVSLGARHGVRMVDSTHGYTRELGRDVGRDLSPEQRRSMRQFVYSSPLELKARAASACAQTGGKLDLIYYLGRSDDLYWLLNGLADSPCADNKVRILSGDDASRFAGSLPPHITLDYTAITFPPAWRICGHDQGVPGFYQDYLNWLQASGVRDLPRSPLYDRLLTDGHTVLGYDATMVTQDAAAAAFLSMVGQGDSIQPAQIRVTPGEVWGQLETAAEPAGASGSITFRPGYRQKKFVPVVQLHEGQEPHIVYARGRLTAGSPMGCQPS